MIPPKHQIRLAFEKAADTYDSAAKVQRWIAARLIGGLPETRNPAAILDAGCGTGFAQEMLALRYPAARRIALDFSRAMLRQVARLEFGIVGDVEHLPLRDALVDLYWSNLTAQWCHPERLAREAFRVLRPGGLLALSSLAPGTFVELEEAFAAVDDHRHILDFAPPEVLHAALDQAGFRALRIRQEPCIAHYKDLKSLLQAIKSIGANQVGARRRPGLMGRDAWKKLEAAYETRRTARGLPLTYQVVLCHAER
jgi:malonyl-CoA O-methyltransferase